MAPPCARPLLGQFALFALVFTLPLAGCDCGGAVMVRHMDGGDDGPSAPGIDGLTSIAITPADATLRLTPTTAASQAYTAMGTFRDHHVEDVTARVVFYIPGPDIGMGLGNFTGATFRTGTTRGGHTTVHARAGDVDAMTGLTLVLSAEVDVPPSMGAPALPASPSTLFGGSAATSGMPELVYPNDGVVLPPNLGRIEIHWLQGSSSNTLFDVAFTNSVTDVHAYTRCARPSGIRSDGCIWEASDAAWRYVARTNAGGDPVTITVRGTTDTGGPVGTSNSVHMQFSYDDLNGTIYYWTTSMGTSVNRYDFGAAAGMAMPVLRPSQTVDGSCVGCHSLSHDGSKIAASTGGINNGGFMLVDLTSGTILANRPASDHVLQFTSFAPDGNSLVAVYGDSGAGARRNELMIFDTTCTPATMSTCGTQTGMISLGTAEASHPRWSPDGSHIAYTDVGMHNSSQRPLYGAVRILDASGSGWSAPRDLAPRVDGHNRYNPDFAPLPMSTFVIYDESTCPGGDVTSDACDADADPSSKVYAVSIDGGVPVLLAAAMAPGTMDMGTTDLQASFPRFAPFVFTLSTGDLGPTSLMWFTFASRRAYGLRSPSSVGGSASWLWMAALRPDKVPTGADASFPGFALPFQQLDTSNHIAVWTTQSVGDGMLH